MTLESGGRMNPKILIIDDEAALRSVISQRLILEGYDVDTAANGREGIARCAISHPDIVITDLLMPEMDGLEVIRTLKGSPHSPLIIAMSGGGSRGMDFLIEAAEFGAIRTLSKPFTLDYLVFLINELRAVHLLL